MSFSYLKTTWFLYTYSFGQYEGHTEESYIYPHWRAHIETGAHDGKAQGWKFSGWEIHNRNTEQMYFYTNLIKRKNNFKFYLLFHADYLLLLHSMNIRTKLCSHQNSYTEAPASDIYLTANLEINFSRDKEVRMRSLSVCW